MKLLEHSQCRKIYNALLNARAAGDGWVEMPELVAASGSYNIHTRIDELRHTHGIPIENVTDVSVRPHISRYRLAEDPQALKTALVNS